MGTILPARVCARQAESPDITYCGQFRNSKEYFDDLPNVKLEPDVLKLAEQILQSKTTDFDPSHFVDRLRPSGYGFFLCNSLGTSRSGARAEEA